jgi:nucleotide-binding universal stress UspA family protein
MYKRILVPIDGSPTSKLGLSEAIRLAKQLQAKVRILHVVDEFIADTTFGSAMYYEKWVESLREGGKKTLAESEAFTRDQGIEPEAILVETVGTRAAEAIIEQARQWPADLIVLGTHGRRGMRRIVMGSDAEVVVRGAEVPVLLVRNRTEDGANWPQTRID